MKEIRLHGRGGQGVVKASQIVVKAAVEGGGYGQFIPFFGVERKGSPVFGYLRLDDKTIRRKNAGLLSRHTDNYGRYSY